MTTVKATKNSIGRVMLLSDEPFCVGTADSEGAGVIEGSDGGVGVGGLGLEESGIVTVCVLLQPLVSPLNS